MVGHISQHTTFASSGLNVKGESMTEPALNISDFIRSDCIFLDVDLPDKEAVLRFIADQSRDKGLVTDAEGLFQGFKAREESMSTGVGAGLAFPHTLTGERSQAAVVIARLSKALDYGAMDDRAVDLVFAVLIPESNQTQHLQILAKVSRLCRKSEFITTVRRAKDPDVLKQAIEGIEQAFVG
jgi:fructose-specific phosphotransferase system IIA component